MISSPAIEPAISTLPVKNQLIANVSSVPNVRQLMALRIDLECVSAPRNKTTRRASSTYRFTEPTTHRASPDARGGISRFAKSSMDTARDCVHFDRRKSTKLLDLTK
jgi:hypothetical protein